LEKIFSGARRSGVIVHAACRSPSFTHCRKGTTLSQQTFGALGVPSALVAVLAADGKREPFPIQADTLPDTLAGRDVLGRGRTGSGKTLAFAIPLAARLASGGRTWSSRPRGLVLAPTRELATQIGRALEPLAKA